MSRFLTILYYKKNGLTPAKRYITFVRPIYVFFVICNASLHNETIVYKIRIRLVGINISSYNQPTNSPVPHNLPGLQMGILSQRLEHPWSLCIPFCWGPGGIQVFFWAQLLYRELPLGEMSCLEVLESHV